MSLPGFAHCPTSYETEQKPCESDPTQADLIEQIRQGKKDLAGANLCWADLTRADLTGATLIGADFTSANLSEADLEGADLRLADFWRTDFTGADLAGAIISIKYRIRNEKRRGELFKGANGLHLVRWVNTL